MPETVRNYVGEAELLQSGGSAGRRASARAGYVPVPLEHLLLEGLARISIYLRRGEAGKAGEKGTPAQFALYCTPASRFTEEHRTKLLQSGVKFVYIALADQGRFQKQVEQHLENVVSDQDVAMSTKSELVYETSVELVNELMSEEGLGMKLPRLESVSRAVTSLVMQDASAFSHLFAASQHDFYTATHMVNVGTWMVALAYAMGITDMDELNRMCVAGMVHDIGKLYVTEEVLNKKGKLSERDWEQLLSHPDKGVKHLQKFANVPELVLRVTAEHHERLDGSGYPRGLSGGDIHLASRICAVVDSFDAMTAFRPFKERTRSFGEALAILQSETPAKYDPRAVETWVELMKGAERDGVMDGALEMEDPEQKSTRQHERFPIECPGRLHGMYFAQGEWEEGEGKRVIGHNISRTGLGFLCQESLRVSEYVRVHLEGMGSLSNREFEGQVVHCRSYSDGWYEVGMKFGSLEVERRSVERAMRGRLG